MLYFPQPCLHTAQELQSAFSPGSHYNDGTWKIVFMDVDKKLGVCFQTAFFP